MLAARRAPRVGVGGAAVSDRKCLTCQHWDAKGVPREAFRMGLAYCATLNTKAVMLASSRECGRWAAASSDEVGVRQRWLDRIAGDTPGRGSFLSAADAGHSRRDLGLFHDVAMGVK